MRYLTRAKARWLPLVVLVGMFAMIVPSAHAATGNNGTVKLDGIPFDDYPDNQPHVTCTFQVDFYNYEQGPYYASVRFWVQPPTGSKILLLSDSVFIGGDPAGGGTDLDGSGTYDLSSSLKPFEAHPLQGYHVKLKVHAPYSIGKDTKYKTFWVTGCAGY